MRLPSGAGTSALIALPLLLAGCAVSPSPPPVGHVPPRAAELPAAQALPSAGAPHAEFVRDFVEAFNTGDAALLADAYTRLFAPEFLTGVGGAEAEAWWRLELHRTYGDLELRHIDSTATPPIVWTQGRVSRAWVGWQPYLDSAGLATRQTVWRPRPHGFSSAPLLTRQQVADSLRAWLDAMAAADLFDGSVVLSHAGEVVVAGAWGARDRSGAPVFRSTRFNIASVTKLLTIVALLGLVEAGEVGLDDGLGRWVPEYPEPYASTVTIRHLLTHRSAIEVDDDPAYLAAVREADGLDDLLRAQIVAIRGSEPRFEPGSEFDYTSEGVDLLGVVLERATGRDWREVVRDRVLAPAGMTATEFAMPGDAAHRAVGYTSLSADLESTLPRLRPAIEILPPVAKPSGGVWSNAADLHSFARALLDGRLLGAAWVDSLMTPAWETGEFEKYGLRGWVGLGAQGEDVWGVRAVGHGGVVPGYSAAIEWFPRSGWLLTVTSNTGEATGYLAVQRLMELVAPHELADQPAPNSH